MGFVRKLPQKRIMFQLSHRASFETASRCRYVKKMECAIFEYSCGKKKPCSEPLPGKIYFPLQW